MLLASGNPETRLGELDLEELAEHETRPTLQRAAEVVAVRLMPRLGFEQRVEDGTRIERQVTGRLKVGDVGGQLWASLRMQIWTSRDLRGLRPPAGPHLSCLLRATFRAAPAKRTTRLELATLSLGS